ncbi:MAG: hypothetical protein N4A33_07800 [Bacteriovoracaceae bacterium]|jgi:hypothetical protein|nr:hypothetical protein [Bacteriovoracaceae bacterium]
MKKLLIGLLALGSISSFASNDCKNMAKNKVKVACAREMLSFVWEALHVAA